MAAKSKPRKIKVAPYDSADYLKTEADIENYLEAVFEEPMDRQMLIHTLGVVARARKRPDAGKDMTPKDFLAECLGCIAQTQSMAPAPTDEFQGVQMPVLRERHFPQSIRAQANASAVALLEDCLATCDGQAARTHAAMSRKKGITHIARR